MLAHVSFQTTHRVFCFISLLLTEKKKQGTVGYQTKNELPSLSRTDLNLK